MPAILFGSISTIADTSELQRQAFNQAFAAHGLDWTWDRDEYVVMLATSGGSSRIEDYAAARGEHVDAGAVHRTKSELFRQSLREARLEPRPGVTETIHQARAHGYKVALVTTTSPENVSSVIDALALNVQRADLDLVVDATDVDAPKPDGAAYIHALRALGLPAGECVAIEDNLGGVQAASAAGLDCVAFPNENTASHDFAAAGTVGTVDRVRFGALEELVTAR